MEENIILTSDNNVTKKNFVKPLIILSSLQLLFGSITIILTVGKIYDMCTIGRQVYFLLFCNSPYLISFLKLINSIIFVNIRFVPSSMAAIFIMMITMTDSYFMQVRCLFNFFNYKIYYNFSISIMQVSGMVCFIWFWESQEFWPYANLLLAGKQIFKKCKKTKRNALNTNS